MSYYNTKLDDVIILSAGTASRSVYDNDEYMDAVAIGIISPATLDATTFVIQVSADNIAWARLQAGEPPLDVDAPAAGKARVYYELVNFPYWRILAGGAVAANRTFKVYKQVGDARVSW
jgi:hypothetical protein